MTITLEEEEIAAGADVNIDVCLAAQSTPTHKKKRIKTLQPWPSNPNGHRLNCPNSL